MKQVLLAAAAGLGLAALLAPAPAEAQYRTAQGYYGYGYDEGYDIPYGGRIRTERVCQRWCPSDQSPCDPPNFKIADGRCRPNAGRR